MKQQVEALVDCPFCGSEIDHVESLAKSFSPPRVYHEWHHRQQNDCYLLKRMGRVVCSSTDDLALSEKQRRAWNTRSLIPSAPGPKPDDDGDYWSSRPVSAPDVAMREALEESKHWHERADKALSKSGRGDADYHWQRGQHKEEIERIAAALSAHTGDAAKG